MKLILIAGCSGSGKTLLAQALKARMGKCEVIALDAYYYPQAELSFEERAVRNYDHPDSLDWPLLVRHLGGLLRGETVEIPEYLFDQHTRARETRRIAPAPVVIVEGILALCRAEIRELAGLRVFVDTVEDECLRRRVQRDTVERGRTSVSVLEQYESTVRPMAVKYVLPSRQFADIIVSGQRPVDEAVDAILRRWQAR